MDMGVGRRDTARAVRCRRHASLPHLDELARHLTDYFSEVDDDLPLERR